jgi:hypothetical protein
VYDQYLIFGANLRVDRLNELGEGAASIAHIWGTLIPDDDPGPWCVDTGLEALPSGRPEREPSVGPDRDEVTTLGFDLPYASRGAALDRQVAIFGKQGLASPSSELVVGHCPQAVALLAVHIGRSKATPKSMSARPNRNLNAYMLASVAIDMEERKIGIGIILLAVSSALLFAAGQFDATLRTLLAIGAAVGLAAGSLLVGTSGRGRPV